MPDALCKFLEQTSKHDCELIAQWLEISPGALDQMIGVLFRAHPIAPGEAFHSRHYDRA
jgi:hypothetical protein